MSPDPFDKSQLTPEDKAILADFAERRKSFDQYLRDQDLKLFTCPACGFPTLTVRGDYENCSVCLWEDDAQDDATADRISSGANPFLSLTQYRLTVGYMLKERAGRLQGKVNDHAGEVIAILTAHNKRMEMLRSNIPKTADRSDPLWAEYEQASLKILDELIKRQ